MSILDRDALAASPLADLHALASELSIDGYRRLRKAELIEAILTRQGGEPKSEEQPAEPEAAGEEDRPASRRRRGRRGGRSRSARDESDEDGAAEAAAAPEDEVEGEGEGPGGPAPEGIEELEEEVERAVRGGRGGADREEEIVEGEVELLPNGSGFLRVSPPEPSEDDVYVSAAQVKRCELVPATGSPARAERPGAPSGSRR